MLLCKLIKLQVGVPEYMVKQLEAEGKQEVSIEDILRQSEPSLKQVALKGDALTAYTSKDRPQALSKAELCGLSTTCLADVLPDLDTESDEAKEQLLEVLSGRVVMAADEGRKLAPWSLCYAGHQFGSYASQLGDGSVRFPQCCDTPYRMPSSEYRRAISILTTSAPAYPSPAGFFNPPVAELQLKGAGRTPFSRFADGLAVLRSSVREYLGSEAVAALGIPTSRALSLVHLPDLPVRREQPETGAVVCRVAPSWLRIGNFEMCNERSAWNDVLKLSRYVCEKLYGYDLAKEGHRVNRLVLKEVAQRNAVMVAAWQAYGFCHVCFILLLCSESSDARSRA